jgi:acyl-CoA thioesterase I
MNPDLLTTSAHLRRRLLSAFALGALGMGAAHAETKRNAKGASGPQKILVLGDSLSAEYGLARGTGWVALLGQQLANRPTVSIVNASISGETTSGGARRLADLLALHRPTHVVIELGANDALRGLALKATQANLQLMVDQSKASGAQVLLVGMMLPPNFGQRYGESFAQVFLDVAKGSKVALVPFMLKGVADRPDARDWFQPDGLHPLSKAHPVILNNIWPTLSGLL